jgi:hypothetical protein
MSARGLCVGLIQFKIVKLIHLLGEQAGVMSNSS